MTFQPSQIGGNIAAAPDYHRLPWANAPKALRAAFEKALDAKAANDEASVNKQAAKIESEIAKAKYDVDATESVRTSGKLPDSDEKEIANYRLMAAEQDVHTTYMAQLSAESELGALLDIESNRDVWREAMEKQLVADQKELADKAGVVIDLTNRIQQLSSYATFLSVWPHYGAPAIEQSNYVAKTIDQALNTKLAIKPVPGEKYGS